MRETGDPRGHRSGGLASLWLERAAVLVLGLYLAGTGLDALLARRLIYTDYIGLRVPAPLALLAGAFLLAVGIRWSWVTRRVSGPR